MSHFEGFGQPSSSQPNKTTRNHKFTKIDASRPTLARDTAETAEKKPRAFPMRRIFDVTRPDGGSSTPVTRDDSWQQNDTDDRPRRPTIKIDAVSSQPINDEPEISYSSPKDRPSRGASMWNADFSSIKTPTETKAPDWIQEATKLRKSQAGPEFPSIIEIEEDGEESDLPDPRLAYSDTKTRNPFEQYSETPAMTTDRQRYPSVIRSDIPGTSQLPHIGFDKLSMNDVYEDESAETPTDLQASYNQDRIRYFARLSEIPDTQPSIFDRAIHSATSRLKGPEEYTKAKTFEKNKPPMEWHKFKDSQAEAVFGIVYSIARADFNPAGVIDLKEGPFNTTSGPCMRVTLNANLVSQVYDINNTPLVYNLKESDLNIIQQSIDNRNLAARTNY